MAKAFKLLIILVNALLSLAYVISSYILWEELNFWYYWSHQSKWTPFWVYPHRIPNLRELERPIQPMLNLPFIIFCIIIITNCVMLAAYFLVIPRLQRRASKNV
ncbi:MAG: hypothetical protein CW691_08090 [Candidatus Bathyarchaeum sp.]|nr:MAG: hypothetical protein CW691_08090 [Candidatus Bathyarchaeum sp.]